MKNAKLIFLQLFGGGIAVFCSPVFAVSGLYLDKSENPLFSCQAIYLNESHIGTGRIGNMCSGEFIGKNKFLTAGHCNEEKFDYIFISCPKYDEFVEHALYFVTDVQSHPEYSGGGNPYDQAILTVERDISFAPVELPENQREVEQLLRKEDCVVFGYGMAGANGTLGTLLGISVKFNGADFSPGVVGLRGFSYPRRGNSGSGLLCRKDPDSKWIRVGTVSQAEVGLANAALLSHSLDWISEQMKTDGAKAEGLDISPSALPLPDTGPAGWKAPTNPPQNRKTPPPEEVYGLYSETYNECVARLKIGASFLDDPGSIDLAIARQCTRLPKPDSFIPDGDISQYLDDKSMDILFGRAPMSEDNLIQTALEAFNFRKIGLGEDLCDLTVDNLIADSQTGVDSSTFTIETKSGEIEFMIEVSTICQLTVSYPYNYSCQSCGTRPWGKYNPIVSADCDGIYVNTEKNLICERDGKARTVNLNYLRFLNRYKKCFASVGSMKDLYNPSLPELSAEHIFYKCVFYARDYSGKPLSLSSLNQLLFVEGADSRVFWTTEFKDASRTGVKPIGPDGTDAELGPIDDRP